MSEYSAVRGGKLKLKSGAVGSHKKKKRKRERSKDDAGGEYKHSGRKTCVYIWYYIIYVHIFNSFPHISIDL